MDYRETIDFLFTRLPMFQRQGNVAFKKDLTNILALMNAIGRPHLRFPAIHVAGTNGKGSVSHMIASVLQSAGYKTGLYTSPHLNDFRERIRINGQLIDQAKVVHFVAENRELIDEIEPSFFEITVALAFYHFAESEVDIAVIETGLGGRLDSTNIINPLVAVITNIGLDHEAFLGDNLQAIAGEKAGIIKPGIPVVIGEYQAETWPVFEAKANSVHAPLFLANEGVDLREIEQDVQQIKLQWHRLGKSHITDLVCDLGGSWQLDNIKTALHALLLAEEQGFPIENSAWNAGLSNIKSNTGLRGRWQVLRVKPLVIADGAHNREGLRAIFREVSKISFAELHIVLGMVADKDAGKILSEFPTHAHYWFCKPDIPRGKDAAVLQEEALKYKLEGTVCNSVQHAVYASISAASENDFVLITGSLFVLAEIPFQQFTSHSNRSPST